jgi:hypothetical protein
MPTAAGQCGRFDLDQAIRLIVGTSARVGVPLELNSAVASIRAAFPELTMADPALRGELLKAADRAQIVVNCGTERPTYASLKARSGPVGAPRFSERSRTRGRMAAPAKG